MVNQTFIALGNNRPQVLIHLEDCVLHAIMGISAGQFSEEVIDTLHSQIESLEKELGDDDVALNWFNISMTGISTPSSPSLHIQRGMLEGDSCSLFTG